jgi:imidazolonepropionase-like amidohydrolase
MKALIHIAFCLFTAGICFSQNHSKILLVNGHLHVGNGETLESALIAIEDGKILFVKNSLAFSYDPEEWDTIVKLEGRHIYPGFVAPNSTLGITEIDAVRATRDYDEVGIYNPHVRSQIAFNVESKVVRTVRTNGVLISQATPRGGVISGSSSVMKLDGWNWEDATISEDDGIHLNWPSSMRDHHSKKEDDSKPANKEYEDDKKEIYDFFAMAEAYARSSVSQEQHDARLAAMRACFKGDKRVYVHADELQQLVDVIEFAKYFKLKFPVIVGGYDAYIIGRKLADSKIPVMLTRPHSLPENEEDDIDLPYKLPFLLHENGVKFCIQNEGDMEAMNARNIPFLAGTAAAYGLSEEEAISSISLWSCEILGIDKEYGSLEKGKSATLFVSDGNALDMRSNNIFLGLIDGVFMPVGNSQSALYSKYQKKYAQQKKAEQ